MPDDTQETQPRRNELAGVDVLLNGCNFAPEWRISMSTTNLTLDSFEPTVTSDGITIVDFWAEWCGPCKMFGPIFEEVSDSNPDVTFAKVDTEAEQQLAGSLGIMSIPTVMIFRDGIQLFAQPGALPKGALEDLLGQVRNLDMDEIRAQLAEESNEAAE